MTWRTRLPLGWSATVQPLRAKRWRGSPLAGGIIEPWTHALNRLVEQGRATEAGDDYDCQNCMLCGNYTNECECFDDDNYDDDFDAHALGVCFGPRSCRECDAIAAIREEETEKSDADRQPSTRQTPGVTMPLCDVMIPTEAQMEEGETLQRTVDAFVACPEEDPEALVDTANRLDDGCIEWLERRGWRVARGDVLVPRPPPGPKERPILFSAPMVLAK